MTERICQVGYCTQTVEARGYCSKHYQKLRRCGSPTPRRLTRVERFWAKVEKTDSCWMYRGGLSDKGYGVFCYGQGRESAHRFAYRHAVGELPPSASLDHICHNRACVNPEHLRVVTNKENSENRGPLDVRNTSGYRGVSLDRRSGRYRAYATHNGIRHYCGCHATAEAAAEAARLLRLKFFTHNDLDRTA